MLAHLCNCRFESWTSDHPRCDKVACNRVPFHTFLQCRRYLHIFVHPPERRLDNSYIRPLPFLPYILSLLGMLSTHSWDKSAIDHVILARVQGEAVRVLCYYPCYFVWGARDHVSNGNSLSAARSVTGKQLSAASTSLLVWPMCPDV